MFQETDPRLSVTTPGYYAFFEYKATKNVDGSQVIDANYFSYPRHREEPNKAHPEQVVFRGSSSQFPVENLWYKVDGLKAEPSVPAANSSMTREEQDQIARELSAVRDKKRYVLIQLLDENGNLIPASTEKLDAFVKTVGMNEATTKRFFNRATECMSNEMDFIARGKQSSQGGVTPSERASAGDATTPPQQSSGTAKGGKVDQQIAAD